jgi:hypothetical protein
MSPFDELRMTAIFDKTGVTAAFDNRARRPTPRVSS